MLENSGHLECASLKEGLEIAKNLHLPTGEIHLWLAFQDQCSDPRLKKRYWLLLSAQEQQQLRRFCFEHDQQRYLLTRVLVRTVLSRYTSIDPSDLRFQRNNYGKPALINCDQQAQRLSFNLSHTQALVVLGITVDRALGVDVEYTGRPAPLEVAENFFSDAEVQALKNCPSNCQFDRFWGLWTLKESYAKAMGLGLAMPFKQFSIIFDHKNNVKLKLLDRSQNDSRQWRLLQFRPSALHRLAICVENTLGIPLRFVARESIPLRFDRIVGLRHINNYN